MAPRTPSSPPTLAGFEALDLIGSGGYADVFLYKQHAPDQKVAIKVMTSEGVSGALSPDLFQREANTMAQVSSHPFIAQIFQAGVSDDGRPYLVMEYYPGANFQQRSRDEQMSTGEVLRTAIQLASAVETAHRASILHRDIKPANILTSAYGDPGLTDFGISSGHGPGEGADGVSIPWAAPEAIAGGATDTRSDIFSLAATVYTMLEGRSPFEIPGGDNTQLALMDRIEREPVPAIRRQGVPVSLERVLANAMAKDPNHRPRTAADFGRQLQAVESEMRLPQTRLNLIGESRAVRTRDDVADDDSTRVKGVAEFEAQPDALISKVEPVSGTPSQNVNRERAGMYASVDEGETVHRPSVIAASDASEPEGDGVNKIYIAAAAVVGVAIVILGVVLFGGNSGTADEAVDPDLAQFEVNDGFDTPVAVSPPSVGTIAVTTNADGTYTFRWDAPLSGLSYAVTPDGSTVTERIEETFFESRARCIQVESIGQSGLISAATVGCVKE